MGKIDVFLRSIKLDGMEKHYKMNASKAEVITDINYLAEENAKKHNTGKYKLVTCDIHRAIFRRGETFKMVITFEEKYQVNMDKLWVRFLTATKKKGITLLVKKRDPFPPDMKKWGIRFLKMSEKRMTLEVHIGMGSDAPIGVWRVKVGNNEKSTRSPKVFYIIFNPWRKDELVYMENKSWRSEYLMRETGILYKGDYDRQKPGKGVQKCYWNYGQFSCTKSLPAAVYVLNMLHKKDNVSLSDPRQVARAMSGAAMKYIIEGMWATSYPPNTNPEHWKGTPAILKRFFMNNFNLVKYGQCWVIAGIVCTLCRAIGIPTRPVTVYDCTHLGLFSFNKLTYIKYLNGKGKEIVLKDGDERKDTDWNFHVWVECWMKRPDLPSLDYGGWQAVETCPSKGKAGPTSVKAIKEGDIHLNYDVHEMYSEVNSDSLTIKKYKNGREEITDRDPSYIGAYIVTKAIAKDEIEDITLNYKYQDGTDREREVFAKTFSKINNKLFEDVFLAVAKMGGVFLDIMSVSSGYPQFGQRVPIEVRVENKEKETRTVEVTIQASLVNYTKTHIRDLNIGPNGTKDYSETVKVRSKSEQHVFLDIQPQTYMIDIQSVTLINVTVNAYVVETKKSRSKGRTVGFQKPELALNISQESLKVGEQFHLYVAFTNRLDKELKSCYFTINSNIFKEQITQPFKNVAAKEEVAHKTWLKPAYGGSKDDKFQIRVYFDSDILKDLNGTITMTCTAK